MPKFSTKPGGDLKRQYYVAAEKDPTNKRLHKIKKRLKKNAPKRFLESPVSHFAKKWGQYKANVMKDSKKHKEWLRANELEI